MHSDNKILKNSAKAESFEAEMLKLLAENNDLKNEMAKLRLENANLKKENSTNSINGIKDEIPSSMIKMADYIRCVKLKKLLSEANSTLVYNLRKSQYFSKGQEREGRLLVEQFIPEGGEKNFKENNASQKGNVKKDIYLLNTAMLCVWLQKLKLDTTYPIKEIKPISDFLNKEKYISEVKYIEYYLKMKEILPELSIMSWDAVLAYSPFPKADLIDKTIFECINFSQKIETAFGPTGKKNKLLISYIDTLFTEFTDQHPAVQLMISTAKKQYLEFGDNMKYVIIFCAELVREVRQFIDLNLSCLEIMNGYQLALEKVLKLLPALSCYQIKNFTDKDDNLKVLKSCVTFGNNGKDIFFKKSLADACISILNEEICFDADNIEISRIPDSDFSNLKIVPRSSRIVVEGFRHYDTHDIKRAIVTGVKTFLAARKVSIFKIYAISFFFLFIKLLELLGWKIFARSRSNRGGSSPKAFEKQ